jgi:agmatinase
VREASRLLRPYNPVQDVEPFSTQQIVDAGDIAANRSTSGRPSPRSRRPRRDSAPMARLLTIGGDHTIALPAAAGGTKR